MTPNARIAEAKDKFLARAGELWDKHESGFGAILEDGEVKKVNISFTAALDFTEGTAVVETKIGYSQAVRDKRVDDLDDPNQPTLFDAGRQDDAPGVDAGGPLPEEGGPVEAHKKRRKRKDAETADDASETEAA